ncbi:uncharacterized protein LOC129744593 [Uranotaenia lowii]|uniref:uncharacterized protein LOC129744593 n=1 Tax=Uranotaenia lowii TaxID=190385 RepID=UPI002479A89C|nr:uncharacterized protein LOC129744593 [Uranotaenia lowii]
MKLLLAVAMCLGVATAARESSLAVLEDLKKLQPAYKNLLDYTVNLVANAKINTSAVIVDFHNGIIQTKGEFLHQAIEVETTALFQLDSQDPTVEAECLSELRVMIATEMSMRGRDFTNCIIEIDDNLNKKIEEIYAKLQQNEAGWAKFSFYDSFAGENIFNKPEQISAKLQAKLQELSNIPGGLAELLARYVDEFRGDLFEVNQHYERCLLSSHELHVTGKNLVMDYLVRTCKGIVVKQDEKVSRSNLV